MMYAPNRQHGYQGSYSIEVEKLTPSICNQVCATVRDGSSTKCEALDNQSMRNERVTFPASKSDEQCTLKQDGDVRIHSQKVGREW